MFVIGKILHLYIIFLAIACTTVVVRLLLLEVQDLLHPVIKCTFYFTLHYKPPSFLKSKRVS